MKEVVRPLSRLLEKVGGGFGEDGLRARLVAEEEVRVVGRVCCCNDDELVDINESVET